MLDAPPLDEKANFFEFIDLVCGNCIFIIGFTLYSVRRGLNVGDFLNFWTEAREVES